MVDPGPNNVAPDVTGAIPPQTLGAGRDVTVELSQYFSDPGGDALTYHANSSDPVVAGVTVSLSQLTVVAISPGVGQVTVTARDGLGGEARQTFDVVVCVPIPDDALHWWTADGTGADRIGEANATLMNGASYVPGLVTSNNGQAFSFDGVDAIGLVPDVPTLNPTGPFSVMAWARPGPHPTPNGAVIGKGHPWSESWVLDTHRNRWRAVIRSSGGSSVSVYGSTIESGAWSHVAMRWDGRILALYVDGQLDGAAPINTIHVNDGPVGIGARSESGFQDHELDLEFAGEVDEVMFFGRALGEEEIRAVFATSTSGVCGG
ncbi:LamG domain-containing protein [Candidatus Palauibacter sp.]|uniref:LamG domain-containing protein n=1 Tax=Candidatus Palauibacter sp. TaxID=3101350 RepID=UPI003B5BD456